MIWPFKKKFHTEHQWQYAPYAFELGRKYVIEVNSQSITLTEIADLDEWFVENGLNVKLVLTKGDGLKPIEVKRMTEVIE